MKRTNFMRFWIACFLLTLGCKECPKHTPPFTKWDTISGREENIGKEIVRRSLYRAKISPEWEKSEAMNFSDTTQANATYFVDKEIKICVHSFPSSSLEERIFPAAQIERWKNQLGKKNVVSVEPISRAGFYGFFLEGEKGENKTLAWAMQLDLDHYQTLQFLNATDEEREHYRQMRADFTIKIAGPSSLIEKHRTSLFLFAESFELIQEIPEKV